MRLSLIDSAGKDRLLIRNPAEYKSGFWQTYYSDGMFCKAASTESKSFTLESEEKGKGELRVTLNHSPLLDGVIAARMNINVWSYNRPIMLIRHGMTNVTSKTIEDLRIYNFMDFDVGGPASYKDDKAMFDPKQGLMIAYDGNPLHVALASKPKPDRWEIAPPTKLSVDEDSRDLMNNLEFGPKDVATGLQWNLGNLRPSESKSVDIVLTSAPSLEEVKALVPEGWSLFDKKIR
ncbi:MAG: hypothetical protein ACFFCP_03930 [Promethearchaeota archaeon]